MTRQFKEKLKIFLHSVICIGLGMAVGFHILPYYFYSPRMDLIMETGIDIGFSSAYKEMKYGYCIIRDTDILFFPSYDSDFYIILKRKN